MHLFLSELWRLCSREGDDGQCHSQNPQPEWPPRTSFLFILVHKIGIYFDDLFNFHFLLKVIFPEPIAVTLFPDWRKLHSVCSLGLLRFIVHVDSHLPPVRFTRTHTTRILSRLTHQRRRQLPHQLRPQLRRTLISLHPSFHP